MHANAFPYVSVQAVGVEFERQAEVKDVKSNH